MYTTTLGLALLWRTMMVYILLAITALIALTALSAFGLDLISEQMSTSALFIKMKPTLMYASFAIALLFAEYVAKINLIRIIWGKHIALTNAGWHRFAIHLALLLLFLAVMNMLVAVMASTSAWVNYKLFGGLSLYLIGHFQITAMLKSSK
jgi:intracellular septation protein A